jgi:hypothetical protein
MARQQQKQAVATSCQQLVEDADTTQADGKTGRTCAGEKKRAQKREQKPSPNDGKLRRTKKPEPPREMSDEEEEEEEEDEPDDDEEQPKITRKQLAAAIAHIEKQKRGKRAVSPSHVEDPEYNEEEDEEEDEDEDVQPSQSKQNLKRWSGPKSAGGSAPGGSGFNTTKKKKPKDQNAASISKFVWREYANMKDAGICGVEDGAHGTTFDALDPTMRKSVKPTCEELGITVDFFCYRIMQYMNTR